MTCRRALVNLLLKQTHHLLMTDGCSAAHQRPGSTLTVTNAAAAAAAVAAAALELDASVP